MLTADDWVARTANVDEAILSPQQIAELNAHTFATMNSMVDLQTLPVVLEADQLRDRLRSVSFRPVGTRCFADGTRLNDADYDRYESALNLPAIAATNTVGFGLCVQRSSMRSYPTDDAVYNPDAPAKLDRFQESGLFPADAVAVLHSSEDAGWLLVQSYNYLAWVRRNTIAMADRSAVLTYQDRGGFAGQSHRNFIVITGDKLLVDVNRGRSDVISVQLDMGIRLPLAPVSPVNSGADDAQRGSPFIVDFPVRDEHGVLQIVSTPIALGEFVSRGYLPFSRRKVIEQAFRFLGENYGWGHADNARDCSGFVAEIYRTVGLQLPRNADDQGSSPIGKNLLFADDDAVTPKLEALQSLRAGDLIYTPGHVMLYLGVANDEPWVIHDASSLNLNTADNKHHSNAASGVVVSPLLKLHLNNKRPQVEAITCLKRFG